MELERVDHTLIREQVINALRDCPEISAAYLYGSALELCRPDSDIDIGLIVGPQSLDFRESQRLEGKISLKLEAIQKHSFDLNIIDPDNTIFAFRVIKEGLPLFIRDRDKLGDFMEKVSRAYDECGWRYQWAIREIKGEVSLNGN